jgi:hypothetical protein
MSGGACTVYAWVSSTLATFIHHGGPAELGGFGDLAIKLDAAAVGQSKTMSEVTDSIYRQVGGGVIKLPVVPEMFDFDFFPQKVRRHARRIDDFGTDSSAAVFSDVARDAGQGQPPGHAGGRQARRRILVRLRSRERAPRGRARLCDC